MRGGAVFLLATGVLMASCREDRHPVEAFDAVTGPESLVVTVTVDSCNGSPRSRVLSETEDSVRFRVEAFDSQDDCADGATLCLDRPLGDRELVDETSGRVVPVRIDRSAPVEVCATPVED